ncbi:MAG TPA: heliorhodopsin HeR [Candidatus Dormibacteraeota bacterium]|nr:heliorhodopsin HeR [Candidatus Dormibacteraeota bacterium]
MAKGITYLKLRRLNLIAGFVHLISGIAIIAISRNFLIPISGNYLAYNTATKTLNPASTTLFNFQLPWLIAIFFFLSAFFHFLIATIYNEKYNSNLKLRINKVRWIEYSLSASVMMVAIAILVGVYDLTSLLMIFALTGIMNLMGLVMEVHNQTTEKINWLSYYIGCISGMIPWIVIAFYFWLSAHKGSAAPTFVYWIFVSIFIFFSCFAVNMVLQYKKIGSWKNYLYGERVYIILSLVAKSLLAWQVFFGTLRP